MTARDTLNAAMSEAEFQSRVIARAKAQGWMVTHFRPAPTRSGGYATAIQGDKGYPDLTLAHADGRVLMLELKAQKGRPTADQRRWLATLGWQSGDTVTWRGGVLGVGVVRPSDWPLVCSILDGQVTS